MYDTRPEQMTVQDAIKILSECEDGLHQNRISTGIPRNPVGGNIYVIDLTTLPNVKDVRIYNFVWTDMGKKKYPKKSPILFKSIIKVRLESSGYSGSFQKHIYEPINDARYILIHYVGDETVFVPFSHGNAKNKNTVMSLTK